MTYLDHDLGPDGASRAPGRPVTTQRTPSGASTPPMLDLQRLAGNAAVSQAIKSGQFDSELPVQRLEGETAEDETEDEHDSDETAEDTGDVQEELDEEADEEEEEDDVEEEAVDEQEEEAEEEQEEDDEEEAG